MHSVGSEQGNGDNAYFYTCNVCAHARARARVLILDPTVASVVTVAKADEHATHCPFESVARTVARTNTVAPQSNHSALRIPRGPPYGPFNKCSRAKTARSAKNRSVAALTTTIPLTETIMASTTLSAFRADATSPPISLASPTGAILSLDLGTTTGWAIRLPGGNIESGSTSFRPSRYDGGGMRYLRFRGWLQGIAADAGPVAAIYFEEVRRHLGTDAAHLYGGFLATLTAWCEQQRIPYEGVPVGSIKRFIAGKGNADKQAVIEGVRSRGFHPKDDNEADAIAILLWAIETGGGVR